MVEEEPPSSNAEGRLEGAVRGKVRSNRVGPRELASAGLEGGDIRVVQMAVMVCW